MKELVVAFGNMVGVLTEPDAASKAPHVVILNSGLVHHVGPGRLAVEIARHVASAGFPALRFDFSGIGDSGPRVPPLDIVASSIADSRETMDHLGNAHGARQFVFLGLCSGARHAHHVATADPRVVGAVMLDGYTYPTTRSSLMAVRERAEDPLAVLAGVKRRALRLFNTERVPTPTDEDELAVFPRDPPRAHMAKDLQALAARRVALLCVFSGEWRQTYRYEGQFRDAFHEVPLGPLLSERLISTAEHLYFTRSERTELLALVTSWLRERFPPN